jgi:hypothetical protein
LLIAGISAEGFAAQARSVGERAPTIDRHCSFGTDAPGGGDVQTKDVGVLWRQTIKTRDLLPGAEYFIAVSPDGKVFAIQGDEESVYLVEKATGKVQQVIRGGPPVAFSMDSRKVAVAGRESKTGKDVVNIRAVVVPNEDQGQPKGWRFEGKRGFFLGLAFLPGTDLVYGSTSDGLIFSWDCKKGEEVACLEAGDGASTTLAFSARGHWMANGYLSKARKCGCIRIWSTRAKEILFEFPPPGRVRPSATPENLRFSPDEQLLVVGTGAYYWELASGELIRRLPNTHKHEGGAASFCADGSLCAFSNPTAGLLILDSVDGSEWELQLPEEFAPVAGGFTGRAKELVALARHGTIVVLDGEVVLRPRVAKPPAKLTDKELAACWDALAVRDAGDAWQAMARLAAASQPALELFDKHLQAAPRLEVTDLETWCAQLDGKDEKARKDAWAKIEQLGAEHANAIRKQVQGKWSFDTRDRLEKQVSTFGLVWSAEGLRRTRAVIFLRRVGTEAARQLVARLAEGGDCYETRFAAQALRDWPKPKL